MIKINGERVERVVVGEEEALQVYKGDHSRETLLHCVHNHVFPALVNGNCPGRVFTQTGVCLRPNCGNSATRQDMYDHVRTSYRVCVNNNLVTRYRCNHCGIAM